MAGETAGRGIDEIRPTYFGASWDNKSIVRTRNGHKRLSLAAAANPAFAAGRFR